MKNDIRFHKDGHCLYLVQDLEGLDLYQRVIAIDNFKNKETKLFERLIDNEIIKIFRANGINVYSTDKSALNRAFDTLKQKGKGIATTDLYDTDKLYRCVKVAESDRVNLFNIWLEDDRYLQVGVEILEIRLWNTLERKIECLKQIGCQ